MDIFIEVTPGSNSVSAIRVRNDLVAISLPVRSTTPASSISGLTPQVISGRASRITTGSTKSAKSLNMIIHFPPDQVKGATDWYFQEMKKKMYVELQMKKKSEIYKACIDQNIAPPERFGDEIKEGTMNDESYINNSRRLQQRVRGNTKWLRRRSTQSCTGTFTGSRKAN